MKVMIVHNRYRSDAPSGENQVVDAEIASLRQRGVDVAEWIVTSDSIRTLKGYAGAVTTPVWNPRATAEIGAFLKRCRPDVVHLHNLQPLVPPQVITLARRLGAGVVQTVHNYRHSCANGTHFRADATCERCIGRRVQLPAVVHGCYRRSRLQTVPLVLGRALHHERWSSVDTFLVLTPFMRDMMLRAGYRDDQLVIRPSWSDDPGPADDADSLDVAFVGRLDEEKGDRTASRRPASGCPSRRAEASGAV